MFTTVLLLWKIIKLTISTDASFFSFSEAQWEGPLDAIWTDAQCKNMCIEEKYKEKCKTKNLEECKNACASTDGCTAFNYYVKGGGSCGFRKCSLPVVYPSETRAKDWGFKGYRIKGKFESLILVSLLSIYL